MMFKNVQKAMVSQCVFNHDPSTVSRGLTPLHRAASQGHIKVVELLLNADAPVEQADDFGRGPQRNG